MLKIPLPSTITGRIVYVNVGGGDRDDLREMANRAMQSGTVIIHEIKDKDQNVSDKGCSAGQETGRRFGTNTIEYLSKIRR